MKTRHIQEMDVWTPPPRIDPEAASFFRGLVTGAAIGIGMWTLFLAWAWS